MSTKRVLLYCASALFGFDAGYLVRGNVSFWEYVVLGFLLLVGIFFHVWSLTYVKRD
jgi:hypothetical protein